MIMKNLIIIFFVFATACAGASLSQKEMDYFCEIALNNEFTSGDNGQISKWKQDIKIKVHEESAIQQEDWNNLNKVIAELNVLVGESINISIVNSGENVEFYFTDRLGLKAHGGRIAGSTNVFGNPFNKAIIAVDIFFGKNNNGTRRQSITNHLVREEIVQTLGLLADSNAHADSIFFKGYSETQGFSDLDKRIVQLLYGDNIKLGMKREEVIESLGVANVPAPQGAPPSVIPSPYVDPNKGLREELEALKSSLKGKDALIASLEAQKQELTFDLVICFNPNESELFNKVTLFSGSLVLIAPIHNAPKNDIFKLASINNEPFIKIKNLQTGKAQNNLDEILKKKNIGVNWIAETETIQVAKAMVERGSGYAVIDDFSAAIYGAEISIHKLEPNISYEICMINNKEKPLSVSAQSFINYLAKSSKSIAELISN